jgi:hypothetical protein
MYSRKAVSKPLARYFGQVNTLPAGQLHVRRQEQQMILSEVSCYCRILRKINSFKTISAFVSSKFSNLNRFAFLVIALFPRQNSFPSMYR